MKPTDLINVLAKEVAGLRALGRLVLALRWQEGLSLTETSAALGLPVPRVRRLERLALGRLRRRLGPLLRTDRCPSGTASDGTPA